MSRTYLNIIGGSDGNKNQGTGSTIYLKGTKKYYKCFVPSNKTETLKSVTLKYIPLKRFITAYEKEFYSRLGIYKPLLDKEFNNKGEYGVFVVIEERAGLNSWLLMIKKEVPYAEICQEFI
jgi:hypothetical protein